MKVIQKISIISIVVAVISLSVFLDLSVFAKDPVKKDSKVSAVESRRKHRNSSTGVILIIFACLVAARRRRKKAREKSSNKTTGGDSQ